MVSNSCISLSPFALFFDHYNFFLLLSSSVQMMLSSISSLLQSLDGDKYNPINVIHFDITPRLDGVVRMNTDVTEQIFVNVVRHRDGTNDNRSCKFVEMKKREELNP